MFARQWFLMAAVSVATCAGGGAQASAVRAARLARVLDRWIKAYEHSRLQLSSLAVKRGKVDKLYDRGLLPETPAGDMTHGAALRALLEEATAVPTVGLAQRVLRLAAMGLCDGRATPERPHFLIRHRGRTALAGFATTECIQFLMQTADGDFSAWPRTPEDRLGIRAAAILALGGMGRPVVRPMLQKQLHCRDAIVRLATAESLGRMQHPRALDDLLAAMRVEKDGLVAQALVRSVRQILRVRGAEIDSRRLEAAVQSALVLLGRTDWRADLEIVELLARVRSAAAVPALIGILERREGPGARSALRVSGRLLQAARDALRSLTGAIIPGDAPEKWRAYWIEVRDTFVVAPLKDPDATRTAAGFFGVPVTGSNVVFLVDASGSMNTGFFPAGDYEPDEVEDGQTRMSVTKRELRKAVRGMAPDAKFNVVSFATSVSKWRRDLVRATPRTKRELGALLETLQPKGATNIFGALQAALGIKTIEYGSRYGVPVDEVFLLSDGQPTAGRVTDPEAILRLIEETNRYSKVRINTIYMGGGGESAFMKKLAQQNGGRYVRL